MILDARLYGPEIQLRERAWKGRAENADQEKEHACRAGSPSDEFRDATHTPAITRSLDRHGLP